MKSGLEDLEEEIEFASGRMLVNNPKEVKDAVKRALKRIEDLNFRMEMMGKDGEVLNDLVKVRSSTNKEKKRVISPSLRSSDKKRKNEEDKREARPPSMSDDCRIENMEVVVERDEYSNFRKVRRKKRKNGVDRPTRDRNSGGQHVPQQKRVQRRNDAILVKAKDDSNYADIHKRMDESVDPSSTDTKVVQINLQKS